MFRIYVQKNYYQVSIDDARVDSMEAFVHVQLKSHVTCGAIYWILLISMLAWVSTNQSQVKYGMQVFLSNQNVHKLRNTRKHDEKILKLLSTVNKELCKLSERNVPKQDFR